LHAGPNWDDIADVVGGAGAWDTWLPVDAVSLDPHAAMVISAIPPTTAATVRGKRIAVISLGVFGVTQGIRYCLSGGLAEYWHISHVPRSGNADAQP
jgi:hypothetical protein